MYDSAAFEISPDLGYHISEATLDDEDIKSLISDDGIFTIDSVVKDMSISASFIPDTFTVTPTYSGCGYVIPDESYTTTVKEFTYFELFPGENCDVQIFQNGEDVTNMIDYYEGSLYLGLSNVSEDINLEFVFSESTSVEENTLSDLEVYPIPCTDNLTIDLNENEIPFSVKIVNIVGNTVVTQESFSGGELNVSSLPNGLYYLIIKKDGKKYVRKFIKK